MATTQDLPTRPVAPPDGPRSSPEAFAGELREARLDASAMVEVGDEEDEELAHGDFVGRYSVLSRLGRGGMGVVYKAYDPQLDRNVAVKLMRRSRSSVEADLRLLREAQTLAKLKHPNVVAVYDAGLTNHGVFIAMELLDGQTLNAWLEQHTRRVHEILAVFRAAGRGLIAAHDAGFVHRDFKPSNVVVGDDDSVKVLDFGLAHLVDEVPDEAPRRASVRRTERPRPAEGSSGSFDSQAGTREIFSTMGESVMGTPAFMAPEQFKGEQGDHRSEQFAFAMSLYVALYDRAPPAGETYEERRENLEQGLTLAEHELERAASGERVPPRVRRVIQRGLATEPEERFASMAEMLEPLAEPPRRWGGVIAAFTLLVGFGVGAAVFDSGPEDPCANPVSALEGTWGSEDQAAVEAVFTASPEPQTREALAGVTEQLDAYAQAWVNMHEESCRATFVTRQQSEQLFDQRMHCMKRRRNRLRSAIDALVRVEDSSQLVQRTILAYKLPSVGVCADLDFVATEQPLPEDLDVRARVAELRRRIDVVDTHRDSGDFVIGIEEAKSVLEDAREVEYTPVVGEALVSLGRLQVFASRVDEAEATLREAIRVASAIGDDRTVATAWDGLVFVRAMSDQDAESSTLELAAWAAVDRADDPEIRSWLLNDLGVLHGRRAEYEQSLDYLRRAVHSKAELFGDDHVEVGISWLNVGNALLEQGSLEDAAEALHQSGEILERTVGSAHPLTRYVHQNLCRVELLSGNPAAAIPYCRRASSGLENMPPTWVGEAVFLLAQAEWVAGQTREARKSAQRARTLAGDQSPDLIAEIELWSRDPYAYSELEEELPPPGEGLAADPADPEPRAEVTD